VIVTPEGGLRLVDFELVRPLGSEATSHGRGTLGYASGQQFAGEPATVADDVYSLGALLYFMATGAEPSSAPRPFALLDRPVRLLNTGLGSALEEAIISCLDPDPGRRVPSMAALDAQLAKATATATAVPEVFGGERQPEAEERARIRYRDLARRLGGSLCAAAQQAADGTGLVWTSRHDNIDGVAARDISTGTAGTLLALSALVAVLGDARHRSVLADGARWLAQGAPRWGGRPLPGLYVGEAGIAAALLHAGQVLGERAFIENAAERSRGIAGLPHVSPDLFNGTAGRIRFHLLLWDETGDPAQLEFAASAGEHLLARAEHAGCKGLKRTIPPGYDGMSGCAYLGYAHGAAGIADVLLDLFEATGDERFLRAAQRAGSWLADLAVPALADASGLNWPAEEGEDPFAAMWCHGAAGVGRFYLHAARLGVIPDAWQLVAGAARSVARGTRWAGPTQCHGSAGSIEFLLDVFQATGDRAFLTECWSLARLLEAFALEREGLFVWPSEERDTSTPDYMVGYAGVAVCLLRLSEPARLPHQLSRGGFRHYGRPPYLSTA
jgi:hypothetical protein